jgi:ADP-ribose pyrophosphatase
VPTIREVAEHSGGAVIVPVFDDGRVILIRQHRYPLGEFIWELPAGKLERNEDPLVCAKRELMEETGYSAGRWEKLNAIFTTPGFCTEVLHIFLARGLTGDPSARELEEGEETMTMEVKPLNEAGAMIDRGEIRDGKSICGILQAIRRIGNG